jgi:glycosyltransferase involved in cell wall biosynthesis
MPTLAQVVRRYIAISAAVAENAAACGTPSERMVIIHNPVTLESYQVSDAEREAVRREWGLAPTDLVVAVFGRITAWKGQLEFLEDVTPLLHAFPEMRILIVGDESDTDNPEYGRRVTALANSPELAGRVVLAGYQKQVPKYYAAADVIVHCSRAPEPFGRVVIEGMAAGKPVVAMREAGPLEIVTDGVDGLLVSPRDSEEMRDALTRLRNDPALRATLGTTARETVRARFSPAVSARRFLAAVSNTEAGQR